MKGLVVGVLHPKAAVCFPAFPPQPESSSSSHAAWQIVQLGVADSFGDRVIKFRDGG